MDGDRHVWEPGLDQGSVQAGVPGSTQTLHREPHGPQEPESHVANVGFYPRSEQPPLPRMG